MRSLGHTVAQHPCPPHDDAFTSGRRNLGMFRLHPGEGATTAESKSSCRRTSRRADVNLFAVDLNDQFPERGMQQGYSCNYRVCTERVTSRPESPITLVSWVPPSFSRDHRTVTTTSSLGRTQHTRSACRPHPALAAIKKKEGVSGRVRFTAPGAVPALLSRSRRRAPRRRGDVSRESSFFLCSACQVRAPVLNS